MMFVLSKPKHLNMFTSSKVDKSVNSESTRMIALYKRSGFEFSAGHSLFKWLGGEADFHAVYLHDNMDMA